MKLITVVIKKLDGSWSARYVVAAKTQTVAIEDVKNMMRRQGYKGAFRADVTDVRGVGEPVIV